VTTLSVLLVAALAATALYAYVAYPALLGVLAVVRPRFRLRRADPEVWPRVSVSLPAHDEERVIAGTLDAILALDYPADRLQVVVVSDASTDRTDEIVRAYADRGVELIRLPERSGKTAAENAAVPHLEGEIVVNTDASTRIEPGSLRALVRAFGDPEVGVASGRDRSVGATGDEALAGETRYVGYEMWLRELETATGGIVGASGCFYGIRADLHAGPVPPELSRDFLSALRARSAGFRAVSVPDAVACVPVAEDLRSEFRRKLRTMVRGLDTLFHARSLLNPFRHGVFAWKLASHKLARWLVPPLLPPALAALAWLAIGGSVPAALLLAGAAGGLTLGAAAAAWPGGRAPPAPVAAFGYAAAGLTAGLLAWIRFLAGHRSPVWEPTPREDPDVPDPCDRGASARRAAGPGASDSGESADCDLSATEARGAHREQPGGGAPGRPDGTVNSLG